MEVLTGKQVSLHPFSYNGYRDLLLTLLTFAEHERLISFLLFDTGDIENRSICVWLVGYVIVLCNLR